MDEIQRHGPSPIAWTVLFILTTLVVLAGGYRYFSYEMNRIRQEKLLDLTSVAELKTAEIQQWRLERLADAQRNVDSPLFRDAVSLWLRNPGAPGSQTNLQDQLKVDRSENDYADALLLNPAGRILLSTLPLDGPEEPESKQAVARAIEQRHAALSEPYLCSCGQIHLDVAAPILDDRFQPMAVLVLRANAKSFLYPLIQFWPTPSRSAETLLIRRDGEDVLYLNELRHRTNTALTLRIPLTRSDLPAVQAVLGKRGIWRGKDYRGVDVLADLRPIAESTWFLVAKVDSEEILAEARYRVEAISLFTALLILLAGSVAAYAYRRQQSKLYWDLYRAERERAESQEEFRATLYSIGDAVITTDTGGRVKQMNPAAEQLTGWTEALAGGRPLDEVFRIVNEETRATVENPVHRVLREGIVVGLANHTVLLSRHGTECPIADCGAPICDAKGAINGVVLVFRDLTEERWAEETLRQSQERYRNLVEHASDAIFINRMDRIVYANNACLNLFRAESADQVLNKTPYDFFHPDYHELVRQRIRALRETGKPVTAVEEKIIRLDGTIVDVEVSASPFLDEGRVPAIHVILRDITERKRTEIALKESEELLRTVSQNLTEGLIVVKPDDHALRWNPSALAMHGYTSQENELYYLERLRDIYEMRTIDGKIVPFEQWPIPRILRGENFRNYEILLRRKQTEWERIFSYSGTLVRGENSHPRMGLLTIHDITERKRAEEALRESEFKYRRLHESMTDAFVVTDMGGQILEFNPAYQDMLSYSPDELLRLTYVDLTPEKWHPIEAQIVFEQILPRGYSDVYEKEYRRKDGTVFPVELRTFLIRDAHDKALSMWAIVRDITERKKADEALRESEERYRSLFDNLIEGFAYCRMIYDDQERPVDFIYLRVNPAFGRIIGVTAPEGKRVTEVFPGIREASPDLFEIYGRVALTGQSESFEFDFKPSNKWLHVTAYSTAKEHFIAVFNDITDRKQAEDRLRASEEKYRLIFENSLVGIYQTTPQGSLIVVNPALAKIFGYDSPGEMQKVVTDLGRQHYAHPEDRDNYGETMRTQGFVENLELEICRTDGSQVWIVTSGKTARAPDGTILYYEGITQDITERKRAEAAMRESEERYRSLFNSMSEGFAIHEIVTDPLGAPIDYRFLDINPGFERLTGLKREDVVGRTHNEVLPDDDPRWLRMYGQVALTGTPIHFENYSPALKRHFEVFSYRNAPRQFAVVFMDITERKQVDEVLRTLLEEKTALLKEIHHRVKNNLQIVDSILNLQVRRVTNAAAVETLRDTQGRIRSMALLHETLYRESNAARVNGATYLGHLCSHLNRSFGDQSERIRLETRVEPVDLSLDRAIPCGLIVNELVTNAFKHAFPGNRAGQITVELRVEPGVRLTLAVADDGVGLPPEFAADSTNTLGLQLVRGLVNQIHGVMETKTAPGAVFQIVFLPDSDGGQNS